MDTFVRIQQALDEMQPYMASHGGRVELIAFTNSVVFIKFCGTCVQCPLSFYTLTFSIERTLKEKFPEILRVEIVES